MAALTEAPPGFVPDPDQGAAPAPAQAVASPGPVSQPAPQPAAPPAKPEPTQQPPTVGNNSWRLPMPPGLPMSQGVANASLLDPNLSTKDLLDKPVEQPAAAAGPGPPPPGFVPDVGDTGLSGTNLVRAAYQNTGIPGVETAGNKLVAAHEALHTGLRRAMGMPIDPEASKAETFSQRMAENEARERAKGAAFSTAHPWASTGAGIAGSSLALAPAAATTLGARLLGIAGGPLATRALTSAGTFGALGAGRAIEQGNDPLTAGAESAIGGALGPVGGAAIGRVAAPAVRAIGRATGALPSAAAETAAREAAAETAIGGRNGFVGRLTDENGNLTNEALEHGIRNGYNSIDDAGDRLKQGAVAEKMKEIKAKMEAAKFRPEYQRAVYKVLDNIAKGGERVGLGPADTTFGDIMGGQRPGVSFSDLRRSAPGDVKFGDVMAARQALNGMSKGVPNKNTAAAQFAKREIDSWLSGGGLKSGDIAAGNPTATIGKLQQLDKGYRALNHAERIKDAMDQAELNAASAGKGTNYANAMRQQAKAILAKDRRGQIPSLDPSVRAGLNKVARGTAYGLRAGSVFAPTGIVSLGGAELFAHAMGMPGAGLASMAAGHLARKGEEALVRGTANRALNLARAQAPMTQAFGRLAPRAASTQPPPMAMLPFLGARARGFGDPQNAKQ